MKHGLAAVPAIAWLVFSYVLLASLIWWSATRIATGFVTTVFIACLLVSWIPAFVFVNRDDMARNKVFWISQSAAIGAAFLVGGVLMPLMLDAEDSLMTGSRALHNWGGVVVGSLSYLLALNLFGSLVRRVFDITESEVEKALTKEQAKR